MVIAPSFADIYYNNGFKNGILNITLPKAEIDQLAKESGPVTVDLENQKISVNNLIIPFTIESYRREALLSGLDEIGEALTFESKISDFEKQQKIEKPWLYRQT